MRRMALTCDNRFYCKQVREKRQSLGKTRKEIAEIVNVTARTVSNWERGITMPPVYKYNEIMEIKDE